MDEFVDSFVVGQYECDLNSRMRLGAMMSKCQMVSTNHCNSLGLTIQKYRETNTVFLLAKASLEVYDEVLAGERVRVVTKPSSPVRAVYSRYTAFYNPAGALLAAQDSKWILVDTLSHKILRNPPPGLQIPFDQPIEWEQDLTIPKCSQPSPAGFETVTYSRTDDNGHLNNAQYADLILDHLPLDWMTKKRIRKMVINYHCEALLGESLEIRLARLDANAYYVCGIKPQGKKCFEAAVWFC